MKTQVLRLLMITILLMNAACKEDDKLSGLEKGGKDLAPVPGCESNGRSGEKNPHCTDYEEPEVEMITPVLDGQAFRHLHAIASDGEYLYLSVSDEAGEGKIYRAGLDGQELTLLYTKWWQRSSGWAFALDVDDANIYFVDPNSGPVTDTQVFRAPKDGSGPVTPIYTESATPGMTAFDIIDGSGIAVENDRLYISDHVRGRISSMGLDGSNPQVLMDNRYGGFFDLEHRNTIAVADGFVFVADSADRGNCNCGEFTPMILGLDSMTSTYETLVAGPPLLNPYDIAVDKKDGSLLVADRGGGGSLFRLGVNGLEVVAAGAPFTSLVGVVVNGDFAYVLDSSVDQRRVFRVYLR